MFDKNSEDEYIQQCKEVIDRIIQLKKSIHVSSNSPLIADFFLPPETYIELDTSTIEGIDEKE